MFGSRYGYGYGYAGGAFGRLLSFLCPMLLLLETLAIVVGLPSTIVRWLWIGLIATLALSAVVALAFLLLGPWRNRFAGVWLIARCFCGNGHGRDAVQDSMAAMAAPTGLRFNMHRS